MQEFKKHYLNSVDRHWPQSNCSIDALTGVMHNKGYNPVPLLAVCVASGYEGDQGRFFKYPIGDLEDLHGIIINELTIYDTLERHIVEQVRRGRIVLTEVDSYGLRDTIGVTYHIAHKKSGIAIDFIDPVNKKLTYYHNDVYGEVEGDDYDLVLGLHGDLVAFTEFIEFLDVPRKSEAELRGLAKGLLNKYFKRIPLNSPMKEFRKAFPRHMANITPETFHEFAFNHFRMIGSNFEYFGSFLQWLGGYEDAVVHCETIAQTTKVMQFRTARMVAKKRFDPCDDLFDTLELAYDDLKFRIGNRK